jgi:MYXO-CTERM domain-containing protein
MRVTIAAFAFVGLLLAAPAVQAESISVNLGQSAQDYLLTGQGTDNPYGTYLNTQGACSAGSSTTSCILSGAFTGTTAGYTGGTYQFITTYPGTGPSELASISTDPVGGANQDYFYFDSIPTGTTMYLDLFETSGPEYIIPIYTAGAFDGGFSVAYVNPVCGGTSLGGNPCEQIYVGLVNGATYSGEVTGSASFDSSTVTATPEPASFSLLGLGVLGLGALVARRRRSAPMRFHSA